MDSKGPIIEGEYRILKKNEQSSAPVINITVHNTARRKSLLEQPISRLAFLGAAAGGALGTLLGITTVRSLSGRPESVDLQPTPSTSPLPTPGLAPTSTPEPVRIPAAPRPEVSMQKTAVALNKDNLNSSFKEAEGFTEKMFEEVRRGTVLIEMTGDKDANDVFYGTGYVIRHDTNSTYFVTNKHMFMGKGNITGLKIWRPNLDTEEYVPSQLNYVATQGDDLNTDIAVVKCKGVYKSKVPLASVVYKERENLLGKNVLVVGFPGELKEGRNSFQVPIGGEVMQILGQLKGSSNSFIARGLISPGSSGSPSFMLEEGVLSFIGIINSNAEVDIQVEPGVVQRQWLPVIQNLELDRFIRELDK